MNPQKKCPVCDKESFKPLDALFSKTLLSDHRIRPYELSKSTCTSCGIATNTFDTSVNQLDEFYGNEYVLNTSGQEEHYFSDGSNFISRSYAFYSWISPFIPINLNSMAEIGCGSGNLLVHFKENFPNAQITGYDGSFEAVDVANKKGVNAKRLMVDNFSEIPSVDFIYSVGVIEHVLNIDTFLKFLFRSLNDKGVLIISMPVQISKSYDLFFADHIWHFYDTHMSDLLTKNGFIVDYIDTSNPLIPGFGLFVCRKGLGDKKLYHRTIDILLNENNYNYWCSIFKSFNSKLGGISEESRVAVFGASEMASLFYCYTELENTNIVAFIDDTKPVGYVKHDYPVHPSEWLSLGLVDIVILCIHWRYYSVLRIKLSKYSKIRLIEIFENV
jgi:2-polyprenyl-3-methyl-5-hydroxy-6-metoxy-1,4-benzoquinol methylase